GWRDDGQGFDELLGDLQLLAGTDVLQDPFLCLQRQDDVFSDAELSENALALSVFRAEPHSRHHGVLRRADSDLAAPDPDLPLGGPVDAENQAGHFGPARAKEAGE